LDKKSTARLTEIKSFRKNLFERFAHSDDIASLPRNPGDHRMDRTAALQRLKAIPEPLFVDGGYWKHGHMLFILTDEGLITVDCRVYDPLLGPIEYSLEQYREITEIAEESDDLERNIDLDPDEKLFLYNNGQPTLQYWAFQPAEDASLGEYTFSTDKADIEAAFINHYLSGEKVLWDTMDVKALITWAEKIGVQGECAIE
jgi:hypothetical protein